MARFQALVKLRSALSREGIGGTLDVMNDLVPANRAKIQVEVFVFGVREHAACEHLAPSVTGSIDYRLLELVVAVFS